MASLLADIPKVEAAIIEITNTVRSQAKLPILVTSSHLTSAARSYAVLLAKSGKFAHDADGTLADRTGRAGYRHCMIAENLASHQDSRGFETRALAKSAVEGWLNSPGHRDNLMSPVVTEIGVAVAKSADPDPKYLLVQVFGRPEALSLTFQVSNAAKQPVTYAFGGKSHDLPPHMAVTHQECIGGALSFSSGPSKPFGGRYEAADGTSYVVKSTPTGLRVDITQRQTVN
jgi:hypothetical protein